MHPYLLYGTAKLNECGIFSDATLSGCSSGSWGIHFYTAGYRATPDSAFVWNVTSTDTSSDVVSAMTYTNWFPPQPDNSGDACVILGSGKNYRWADWNWTERFCSVCELDI